MTNHKYNIVISEGCTSYGTVVNDKDMYGEGETMSKEEITELVEYLCDQIKSRVADGEINVDDVIKLFPYENYEYDDNSCETCGDTVHRTYYEI